MDIDIIILSEVSQKNHTIPYSTVSLTVKESESHSLASDSLRPHRLDSPWNSPGQNTGVGSLSLLQGIFPTQGLNPSLPHCRQILYQLSYKGSPYGILLLLLSCFSRVQLCVTPEMAAHQAPPSLGSSRQEYWSGLPFPPPMYESEK